LEPTKKSKVIELVGLLHADICNASTLIISGFTVNVLVTRTCREFYLIAHDPDSKVSFKILEARMLVSHIEPNPSILHAHNTTLEAGGVAKYDLTRVVVKTFTFEA
jgi:hypothetical protein